MLRALRRTPFAAVCSVVLVAACAKGENNADSARLADSAAAASAAPVATAPAAPTLTDANIVAILDNANAADSTHGALAVTMTANKEVKSFAQEMMRDHHALRKGGQDLAKKLGVTPEMPAGDNSAAAAMAWQDSLKAMTKGASFDKAYIDHEVAYHTGLLQTAQTAAGAAQNAELKAFIEKAAPAVQSHLDHAKALQSKMGGMAAGDTAMKH